MCNISVLNNGSAFRKKRDSLSVLTMEEVVQTIYDLNESKNVFVYAIRVYISVEV
jgi:hypothetical protein